MSESRLRYPMVMPCKFNYTDPWCCILSFYSVIVYMVFLECHVIIIVQGHTLCPVMEGWRNCDPWWTQAIGPYGVACCVISVETWRGHQCLNYLQTACNTQTRRERNLSMLANAEQALMHGKAIKMLSTFYLICLI